MTRQQRRLVVLDRDGVINVDIPGRYVCNAEQWVPIAGSLAAMGRLSRAGFEIYVVSNQSGIGRGLFTVADLAEMHEKLVAELGANGGQLAGWFYCPHTPADGCRCRKPGTGLLEAVSAAAGKALDGVPFIGDKWTDLVAARAMKMRPVLVGTGHGADTIREHGGEVEEFYIDLAHAADCIIEGAASPAS